MKILVPNIIPIDPAALHSDDRPLEVVPYSPTAPVPDEHTDADALVAWGNTPEQLADTARRLHRLRWIQDLAAGPAAVLNAGFPDSVCITTGSSLHNQTVSEHALALTLAAARHLHSAVRAQIGHRWASEIGGLQPLDNTQGFSTLRQAQIVIWGFGNIGRTLAPLLTALGADVRGLARTARTVDDYEVVTDVERVLPTADVLIMILPAGPATDRVLDAHHLSLLKPSAWIVNVGRGSTIDEQALIDALRSGRLAGAALDVTTVEPLPTDSPLWDLPNVILTPHAAGGRPLGAAELIRRNARALQAGEPLENVHQPGRTQR